MSSRMIQLAACQALYDDECLRDLLDTEAETTHGSERFCDEPLSTHGNPPVRRAQMGWPSDFKRACVTVAAPGAAPFNRAGSRPWFESWSFVVSMYARETIKLDNGQKGGTGDLWLSDIYDRVRLVLGVSAFDGGPPVECSSGIAVFSRSHFGDVNRGFEDTHRHWFIQTRFVWLVLSRGLVAPICVPCGTV